MAISRHPNKHIAEAVHYALERGWRLVKAKRGHAWGHLYCPRRARDGHIFRVWSTPKHPEDHAKDIVAAVDDCEHEPEDDNE